MSTNNSNNWPMLNNLGGVRPPKKTNPLSGFFGFLGALSFVAWCLAIPLAVTSIIFVTISSLSANTFTITPAENFWLIFAVCAFFGGLLLSLLFGAIAAALSSD